MESGSKRVGARSTFKKDFFYKNALVLSVHIDYPFAEKAARSAGYKRMARFYRSVFSSFRKYCQLRLLAQAKKSFDRSEDGEFESWFAALTYQITYESDTLVSLYYERREYKGAHARSLDRYADTWSLPRAIPLELSDILGGKLKRKELLGCIAKSLEAQKPHIKFYSDYKKRARIYFSPRRFFVTERGAVVFYQPMMLQNDPETVCEVEVMKCLPCVKGGG